MTSSRGWKNKEREIMVQAKRSGSVGSTGRVCRTEAADMSSLQLLLKA